jgi:hypothetical protein
MIRSGNRRYIAAKIRELMRASGPLGIRAPWVPPGGSSIDIVGQRTPVAALSHATVEPADVL